MSQSERMKQLWEKYERVAEVINALCEGLNINKQFVYNHWFHMKGLMFDGKLWSDWLENPPPSGFPAGFADEFEVFAKDPLGYWKENKIPTAITPPGETVTRRKKTVSSKLKTNPEKLKCAFWLIEKIGDPDETLRIVTVAVNALKAAEVQNG